MTSLAEQFRLRTGEDPEGEWAAPGRVNLVGEHTDYNAGFVLPIAIDRRAVVAVRRRGDGRARCWSLQEIDVADVDLDEVGPGRVHGWTAYPLGTAWALRALGVDVPGFDLAVDSDVPPGGGLSSSAALECATATALLDLAGEDLGLTDVALAARRAENDVVGAPTGVMDQMVSLRAQAGHALFLDCRTLDVANVPFDVVGAGLTLLVIDTGARHATADGRYAERRRECEAAAVALGVRTLRDATPYRVESELTGVLRRRARHVVTENDRVLETVHLLRNAGPASIGRLLTESHVSLRDDFEVSTEGLDLVVSAALASGAEGARLTGAGFGGCAIALVSDDLAGEVATAVRSALDGTGQPPPRVFPVRPVDGARRIA